MNKRQAHWALYKEGRGTHVMKCSCGWVESITKEAAAPFEPSEFLYAQWELHLEGKENDWKLVEQCIEEILDLEKGA